MRWILFAAVGLAGALVLLMGVRSLMAERPEGLGARQGRLAPCPQTPNCVSSQAEGSAHVEPLPAGGAAADTLDRLAAILTAQPRCRIVERADGYLHAECRSFLFRFVDDLELLADPAADVIHVRSAARTGHTDMGVNRQRVETLRARLAAGG